MKVEQPIVGHSDHELLLEYEGQRSPVSANMAPGAPSGSGVGNEQDIERAVFIQPTRPFRSFSSASSAAQSPSQSGSLVSSIFSGTPNAPPMVAECGERITPPAWPPTGLVPRFDASSTCVGLIGFSDRLAPPCALAAVLAAVRLAFGVVPEDTVAPPVVVALPPRDCCCCCGCCPSVLITDGGFWLRAFGSRGETEAKDALSEATADLLE